MLKYQLRNDTTVLAILLAGAICNHVFLVGVLSQGESTADQVETSLIAPPVIVTGGVPDNIFLTLLENVIQAFPDTMGSIINSTVTLLDNLQNGNVDSRFSDGQRQIRNHMIGNGLRYFDLIGGDVAALGWDNQTENVEDENKRTLPLTVVNPNYTLSGDKELRTIEEWTSVRDGAEASNQLVSDQMELMLHGMEDPDENDMVQANKQTDMVMNGTDGPDDKSTQTITLNSFSLVQARNQAIQAMTEAMNTSNATMMSFMEDTAG